MAAVIIGPRFFQKVLIDLTVNPSNPVAEFGFMSLKSESSNSFSVKKPSSSAFNPLGTCLLRS